MKRKTSTFKNIPNESYIDQFKSKKLEKESPIMVKTIASKSIAMNSRTSFVFYRPSSERIGAA